MSNLTNKLLALRETIESAKTNSAKLEGKLSGFMEQLEKDFGCKSVEEAQTKLKNLEKEIQAKESELESGMEELDGIL